MKILVVEERKKMYVAQKSKISNKKRQKKIRKHCVLMHVALSASDDRKLLKRK